MEEMKKAAALKALELVQPGMKLGLGTGSTARHLVDGLGARVADGLEVICVPTSEATRIQAESLSIPLGDLGELKRLDLTIDGADEIDPNLRLIKGGGAALLREKIVAAASTRMVVIADDSKCVDPLGAFPLPVEVNPFAHAATADAISDVITKTGNRADIVLRMAGAEPLVTDGGHYIYDCKLGEILSPEALALALNQIPGVVEHGLFIGLADLAFIAGADGVRQMGNIE
jgi:ribose 5-phosphate isomerase A